MNRLLFAAALALVAAPAAAQSNIRNADLRERTAGDLAQTFRQLAGEAGPIWVGYAVAAQNGEWNSCCHDDRVDGWSCCGRCWLEERAGSATAASGERRSAPVELEAGARAVILYRIEGRQVQRIRLFSGSCELDAGGRTVHWLTGVQMPASVALLATYAADTPEGTESRRKLTSSALAAIAAHGDPAADRALERFLQPGQSAHTRRQAAFWAANARGRAGFDLVRRALRTDTDEEFRRRAVFALSQSREPEVTDALVQIAKTDASARVRGEAIFWLAQKAGERAVGAISDAIDNDPDTKVKERAVFALSQLPKDEGVPKLIEVARTNRNAAVRKRAIFWLGQSRDPRALRFFEEILKE
ncbi:MAG TPA: HEAT repeat domain-containing protein [Vicinamibacterales bacterium]|nr:HEAT repeat domain-containing protein [Vicinamibacterales bacterium]